MLSMMGILISLSKHLSLPRPLFSLRLRGINIKKDQAFRSLCSLWIYSTPYLQLLM